MDISEKLIAYFDEEYSKHPKREELRSVFKSITKATSNKRAFKSLIERYGIKIIGDFFVNFSDTVIDSQIIFDVVKTQTLKDYSNYSKNVKGFLKFTHSKDFRKIVDEKFVSDDHLQLIQDSIVIIDKLILNQLNHQSSRSQVKGTDKESVRNKLTDILYSRKGKDDNIPYKVACYALFLLLDFHDQNHPSLIYEMMNTSEVLVLLGIEAYEIGPIAKFKVSQ